MWDTVSRMVHRFYAPAALDSPLVRLEGAEAQHLLRVLRLKVGDEVSLFDGKGHEAAAEIATVSRSAAELRLLSEWVARPRTVPEIILGTAAPKGDRFRWLVEKVTELGVDRLVPLLTERSVVDPGAGKLQKMQQTVIAACKQCGRNSLMQIDPATAWSEFVSTEMTGRSSFIAHSSERIAGGNPLDTSDGSAIVLAIGPEGGWTDAEIDLAREAGAKVIGLGSFTLRIETAACALVSRFVMHHGDA